MTAAGCKLLWYVTDDLDGQGPVLHLFAADKSMTIAYFLAGRRNDPGQAALVVERPGGVRATLEAPAWGTRSVATPAFMREIAEWALASVRNLIPPPDSALSPEP